MASNSQISGSFPKNLAFNLRKLEGSLVRQKIRVNSDKTSYVGNERASFNFPLSRMIDLRTINLNMKATTVGAGNHFPRYASSLIDSLQITANGRTLQSTMNYNYIFNCLADIGSYGSVEQMTKHLYNNGDPSIRSTNLQGEGTPVLTKNTQDKTNVDSLYLVVNNWLGFFNGSCSTLNLNDIGLLNLTITWAGNGVLWVGTDGTAATGGSYKIEECFLSMDCITYTNSLYHDLVKSALEGENGLKIAYNEYIASTGNLVAKSSSGITQNFQVNTGSLDGVFATCRPTGYDTISPLQVSTGVASSLSLPEVLANPVANASTYGGFNNSKFFIRDFGGIDYASWTIDGVPFTNNAQPHEIFNNTLNAFSHMNIDMSAGGLHQGALTSGFYNKFYAIDYLTTENISGDSSQNFVSGLNSNGGVIQIQWQGRFKTVTDNTYIFLCAITSKILTIRMGRSLDLMD